MGVGQTFADAFRGLFNSQTMLIVYGAAGAVAAGIAFLWSKYPLRWALALLTGGVVLTAIVYRDRAPTARDLDPDLPSLFLPPRFLFWALALTLAVVYLLVHLGWVWFRSRRAVETKSSDETARFPDLESAWDEIQIRLSHAHYDAGRQNLFLLLGTEEPLAASMVRGAGPRFFAQAPADENAPIHAYATADGLFLSCAGASAWGRGDEEGTARLAELCRKIRALNPEQPVARGLVVLYPIEQAASTELLQRAAALRNDLQTIRAELNVRCPTVAVFCLRGPYSGFEEFAARAPPNVRARRCGFSVPLAEPFSHESALKGMSWLVQWFSMWSLKLMTDEHHRTAGNHNLVLMNSQLWRDLPALCNLVETSFSTHARAEPVLVRGCYFVACGPGQEGQAFINGLVGGKTSKIVADAAYTTWSRGADAIDRRYRRAALALGLATAAIVLPIWYLGIIARLGPQNVQSRFPAGVGLAWAALGALALIWVVGLGSQWFGRKRAARSAPEG